MDPLPHDAQRMRGHRWETLLFPVAGKLRRPRGRAGLLAPLRSYAGVIRGSHLHVQPPARFRSALRKEMRRD